VAEPLTGRTCWAGGDTQSTTAATDGLVTATISVTNASPRTIAGDNDDDSVVPRDVIIQPVDKSDRNNKIYTRNAFLE